VSLGFKMGPRYVVSWNAMESGHVKCDAHGSPTLTAEPHNLTFDHTLSIDETGQLR